MQLKLTRTQRDRGVLSKNVVFCLNARAELTHEERSNLSRYKLYDQVIYNSERARKHLDKSIAHTEAGGAGNFLKGMAHLAMTALNLNITVRGLEKGQYIECKSLDELLAAQDAIMDACKSLKSYLDTAATFDGKELLLDFSTGSPQLVAQSIAPAGALFAPASAPFLPSSGPAPQLAYTPSSDGYDQPAQTENFVSFLQLWWNDPDNMFAKVVVGLLIVMLLYLLLAG